MKSATQHGWLFIALACLALYSASHQNVAVAGVSVSEFRSLVPVYRFWSPLVSRHFYTISEAERDLLIANYPVSVWAFEGVVYYVYARESEPGLMPVHRFWSPITSGHFYTINEAERDLLIDEQAAVWAHEGPAFYAYPPGRQPAQANAVYRFWSPVTSGHFYTINEAERDLLINEYAAVWTPEDVAWYAYADPNVVEPIPPAPGTFEFSGGAENASCTFTLKAYLNGVEATIDDPRLTFVPQTGYMRLGVDFDGLNTTIEEVLIETASAQHTTTIRGGAAVIPVTVSSSVIFWAATPRGPYHVNPQNLTFGTAGNSVPGNNETFTLTGSMTAGGSNLTIGLAVRATRFLEGQGQFDDEGLPSLLDVRMAEPFQWSRSQREDRLIQTTIGGSLLQLYITSAQVRTTGLWQGERAE